MDRADRSRVAAPGESERRLVTHCLLSAARALGPADRVRSLLPYLECFPLGAFNRDVAQRIEDLLCASEFAPELRERLRSRFRGLRDPLMPELDELG